MLQNQLKNFLRIRKMLGNGSETKYLLDPARKVPKAHLKVCNIGCGKNTCRYLGLTVNGYVCVKNTPLRDSIDKQVELANQGKCKFTAQGNNCEGFGTIDETQNKEAPFTGP